MLFEIVTGKGRPFQTAKVLRIKRYGASVEQHEWEDCRLCFLGPDDVDMVLDPGTYGKIAALPAYEEVDEVMIHYTVTQECPFNCRGCINALTAGKGNSGRSAFFPGKDEGRDLERTSWGSVA